MKITIYNAATRSRRAVQCPADLDKSTGLRLVQKAFPTVKTADTLVVTRNGAILKKLSKEKFTSEEGLMIVFGTIIQIELVLMQDKADQATQELTHQLNEEEKTERLKQLRLQMKKTGKQSGSGQALDEQEKLYQELEKLNVADDASVEVNSVTASASSGLAPSLPSSTFSASCSSSTSSASTASSAPSVGAELVEDGLLGEDEDSSSPRNSPSSSSSSISVPPASCSSSSTSITSSSSAPSTSCSSSSSLSSSSASSASSLPSSSLPALSTSCSSLASSASSSLPSSGPCTSCSSRSSSSGSIPFASSCSLSSSSSNSATNLSLDASINGFSDLEASYNEMTTRVSHEQLAGYHLVSPLFIRLKDLCKQQIERRKILEYQTGFMKCGYLLERFAALYVHRHKNSGCPSVLKSDTVSYILKHSAKCEVLSGKTIGHTLWKSLSELIHDVVPDGVLYIDALLGSEEINLLRELAKEEQLEYRVVLADPVIIHGLV